MTQLNQLVKKALGDNAHYPSIKWTSEPTPNDDEGITILSEMIINIDKHNFILKGRCPTHNDTDSIVNAIKNIDEKYEEELETQLNKILEI